MFDFVGIGLLLVLVLLFGWLTARARRLQRAPLRWGGVALGGVLTVALTLATGTALYGFYRLNQTHSNPVPALQVAGTPDQIERGIKFARACAGCHSSSGDLPLSGQNFFDAEAPPFGTLWAPNLTPAHLQEWSDGEIARAIREGVHKNGRSLVIMPSGAFRSMSDEDMQALIAYLRTQPAVEPNTPPTQLNTLGAILVALTPDILTAQEPVAGPVSAPVAGATPEYGRYLSTVSGCSECHSADLNGLAAGPEGPTPSLHTRARGWSAEQFIQTIRTGVTPEGDTLDNQKMPWKDFELYSDDDLEAIHIYLNTLPASAATK